MDICVKVKENIVITGLDIFELALLILLACANTNRPWSSWQASIWRIQPGLVYGFVYGFIKGNI